MSPTLHSPLARAARTAPAAAWGPCDYKFLRNTPHSHIKHRAPRVDAVASRVCWQQKFRCKQRSVNVQRVARRVALNASVAVANLRHVASSQLHSNRKFGAVAPGENGGTCPPESHRFTETSRINNPKGTCMKCASIVKAAAAAALVVGMA